MHAVEEYLLDKKFFMDVLFTANQNDTMPAVTDTGTIYSNQELH